MPEQKLWAHYCLKDHGLEYVERGRECNWCGARETDIPIERNGETHERRPARLREFIARAA